MGFNSAFKELTLATSVAGKYTDPRQYPPNVSFLQVSTPKPRPVL